MGDVFDISCWSAGGCVAVGGNCCNSDGLNDNATAARWNGHTWRRLRVRITGDFEAVSCTSADFCLATGTTTVDSDGDIVPFARTFNGQHWRGDNPMDAGESDLSSVSCSSRSRCTAAGSYYGQGGQRPLIERWTGGSWHYELVGHPAGASQGQLNSVDCSSAQRCVSAGFFNRGRRTIALVERWDGAQWSVLHPQGVHSGPNSDLSAIACPSPTRCLAVGEAAQGVTTKLIVARLSRASWSSRRLPDPAGPVATGLTDISCSGPTHCKAVGRYYPGSNVDGQSFPVAYTWNGTSWRLDKVPLPSLTVRSGDPSAGLRAISCSTPDLCLGVGELQGNVPLLQNWNGRRWSNEDGALKLRQGLADIACGSSSVCVSTPASEAAKVAVLSSGRWSVQTIPSQPVEYPAAVTCASSTYCLVAGTTTKEVGGSNVEDAFVDSWNGTTWKADVVPDPGGGLVTGGLSDVSCSSATACTAVAQNGAMAERWDGSSWTSQTMAPGPTTIGAVSCPTDTSCVATGTSFSSLEAEIWNGTSWQMQRMAGRSTGRSAASLGGLACVSQAACWNAGSMSDSSLNLIPIVERLG